MSDDNKLLKMLEAFYKLSIIQPHEEGDEARLNEARTSAFLLIKTARENGVKIKFLVPPPERKVEVPPPPRPPRPSYDPRYGTWAADPFSGMPADMPADFGDLFGELFREESRRRAREQEAKDRENFARMQEEMRKQREREAQARRDSQPFTRPQSTGGPRYGHKKSGSGPRPPIIQCGFVGVCRTCNKQVNIGESVYWVRAVGVSHEACGYEDLREVAGEG